MVYVENELIGRRLRKIRKSLGMDYIEMGEMLGISDGHYRKIERGIYGLDVKKLLLMYSRLGVDPLYLLTGNTNRDEDRNLIDYDTEDKNLLVCELLDYCKTKLVDEE